MSRKAGLRTVGEELSAQEQASGKKGVSVSRSGRLAFPDPLFSAAGEPGKLLDEIEGEGEEIVLYLDMARLDSCGM